MTHADDAERHIANRAADAAYAEIADSLAIALPPLRDATRSAWRYRSVFARWARVEFRTRQTRLAADGLRWRDRPAWLTGRAATAALCLTAAISADDLGARWGGPFTTFGVLAATAYLRLAGRQLPVSARGFLAPGCCGAPLAGRGSAA